MAEDWTQMWKELGLELENHDKLMAALGPLYLEWFADQPNRPQAMQYFDFVISEVHGLRIKELLDHKGKGGAVVGTFCLFVPEEVVVALDGVAVGLCAGTDFSVPIAEAELPRNLCPLIKSFYGFKRGKICPYFESADVVVGETTCDGKKKVYEHLGKIHPVYVMEVPNKKGPADRELWRAELNNFVAAMEEITGNKLSEDNLAAAVKKVNAKRRALRRVHELRWNDPAPISGKDALLIMQISFYDDLERFTRKADEVADELEKRVAAGEGVFPAGTPRLMVSGTPMAIPNWKVHHVVETSGAAVVAEEMCTGFRYYKNTVNEDAKTLDEMKEALVDHYMDINCACFTPNEPRLDDIEYLYKNSGAQGIIHATLSFCTPYLLEQGSVKRFAAERDIPLVAVETDYSEGDVGQLKTRVEALIEQVST
jgi:benzoyl-CoA reductase/2-hydroxyglutaryl-CoA dehydratase subunit BcrC/BadD/HgdB